VTLRDAPTEHMMQPIDFATRHHSAGAASMHQAEGQPAPTVLVVDDEPELRSLLAEYFGRHGFTVRTAADAFTARALVAG